MREKWDRKTAEEKAAWAERSKLNAFKQMSDPENRKKAAVFAKEGWEKTGHKARFEMTDEIKDKISASQKGKRRKWMDEPDLVAVAAEKQSRKKTERFARLGQEGHELFRPGSANWQKRGA